ncbi:hypothetical protein BHM03_00053401 [Ensete ventricosum]|nr:hypothetical protein BHM03_00053401 [Ensete ventricosum]
MHLCGSYTASQDMQWQEHMTFQKGNTDFSHMPPFNSFTYRYIYCISSHSENEPTSRQRPQKATNLEHEVSGRRHGHDSCDGGGATKGSTGLVRLCCVSAERRPDVASINVIDFGGSSSVLGERRGGYRGQDAEIGVGRGSGGGQVGGAGGGRNGQEAEGDHKEELQPRHDEIICCGWKQRKLEVEGKGGGG